MRQAIPALAELAGLIGDPAVRNRGTIGGSIANNDPAADYPAACLALGATIVTNKRKIAADEFFTGLFETALEAGEIIAKVSFPIPQKAGYAKFRNPASRYALVGVFVAKRGADVRVAVTGAGANGVFRARAGGGPAKRFAPKSLDGIAVPRDGLNSDIHADADYRAHLIGVMAKRAVDGDGVRGGRPTRLDASCRGVRLRLTCAAVRQSRACSALRRGAQAVTAAPASIDETLALLHGAGYVADRALATVLFLAPAAWAGRCSSKARRASARPRSPRCWPPRSGRRLIRLQCYEGLDVASAVYEWNYAGQMMAIRLAEAGGAVDRERLESDVFSERYLIKRPLLQALEPDPARRAGAAHRRARPHRRGRSRLFCWRSCPTSRSRSRSSGPSRPSSRRSSSSPRTAPARSTTR